MVSLGNDPNEQGIGTGKWEKTKEKVNKEC